MSEIRSLQIRCLLQRDGSATVDISTETRKGVYRWLNRHVWIRLPQHIVGDFHDPDLPSWLLWLSDELRKRGWQDGCV